MPKDKAIAIAADKCSREKHSTQCTSPPWSNEKIAINKKQVSSQLLKCCKNTRHDLRSRIFTEGRYTDAVDEVLLKIIGAKRKKFKIVYTE